MSLTTEERIARIHDLDLEPIVFKLITPDGKEPAKMTLGEADNAVSLYRKFLILLLLHPSECIPPSLLIDEVWHAHILDTSKYRVDCDDIFGYYLDHFPYLGQRGPDDAARLQKAFATTQQLFMSEFGIDLSLTATNCGTCCPGACTDHIRGGLAQNERPRPDRNTPVLV
ncbi:MAG: hypothetical protein J2P17_04760 [Mycobacterium sp.]|nr:hypothetical protein [Mycobacterium sp.]